jgi:hypothetical protein
MMTRQLTVFFVMNSCSFCHEQLKTNNQGSLRLSDWSNCLSLPTGQAGPKWNAGGLASAEGATLRDEGAARKKVAG